MRVEYADDGSALTAASGGRPLFRYVYRPQMPAEHAPRPYFHPLLAPSGRVLTDIQPADHPWHYGLSFAVPDVSGVQFWGGPTYIHGHGYVARADHGRVEHLAWADGEDVREHLLWLNPEGQALLTEVRDIRAQAAPDGWSLRLAFALRNETTRPLTFASPAVHGRVGAGYGGLFFRAAPVLHGWQLAAGDRAGEDAVHGAASASLTWSGDGEQVAFHDDRDNPTFASGWFVRQRDYPGVCFPFAFARALVLAPGETLRLRCALALTRGD